MPVFLQEHEQDAQSHGPRATDPSLLSAITAPTLVMHGARSARRDWFARGAEHVATHVADAQRREVPDAGHFGVACAPQVITDELVRFFAHAPTPS
jgi:pimeloyl-ACP methyl ester carboxylesterase